MEGVRATTGVFHIVLTTIFAIGGELDSTVVEKALWIDLGIVLMMEKKKKKGHIMS